MKKQKYLAIAAIGTAGVCGLLASHNTFAKAAVHTAFGDERFYQCVVTAYNNKEQDTKDYQTDILTNEELLKITSLNCSKKDGTAEKDKIVSTSGLEKLTNITSLDLKNNQIENIDLSKNTKLVELDVRQNKLNSLNISNNDSMQKLLVESYVTGNEDQNDVKELDISNNPKLEHIVDRDAMLLNDIELTEGDGAYTMDLKNLKFIVNGITGVETTFEDYSYDANNFIVTIPKNAIQKISYISLSVKSIDNMSSSNLRLAVNKVGIVENDKDKASNTTDNTKKESTTKETSTTDSTKKDDTIKDTSTTDNTKKESTTKETSTTDSTKKDDTAQDTSAAKQEKPKSKAPDTGMNTDNQNYLAAAVIVLPVLLGTAMGIRYFIRTRKSIKLDY